MKKIPLTEMTADQAAKISEIQGGAQLQNKLMGMGIYPGKTISKLSHIGLKGPQVIKVGRTILALGHGVAAKILVEAE